MKRTRRFVVASVVLGLFAVLAAGELVSRFYLGLGTPPLSMSDPEIEYMFRPNQDVRRFGNRILINAYGMRTPDFQRTKQQPGEFRLAVIGDSVINGGNLSDHESLATTILQHRLAHFRGRKVVVANISAGSWGPGNWLAYTRRYGFFDVDSLVVVVSSHDYADIPTFAPLNPLTHPTSLPVSALVEGAERYLPRYLPLPVPAKSKNLPTEAMAAQALGDLRALLESARAEVDDIVVFQHWTRSELKAGKARPGNQRIRALCDELGVPVVSLHDDFVGAEIRGEKPYRDDIHLTDAGQRVLAGAIERYLQAARNGSSH